MFPLHWMFAAFCAAQAGAPVTPAAPAISRDAELDRENLMQLLAVRRVYVDRMDGGETASQLRDMIISGLQRSKLFAITENQERADAVLRGSGEDLVFTDTLSSSDGINAHSNFGINNGSSTNSRESNNSWSSRDQRGVSGRHGCGRAGVGASCRAQTRGYRLSKTRYQRWRRDLVYDTGEQGREVPGRQCGRGG